MVSATELGDKKSQYTFYSDFFSHKCDTNSKIVLFFLKSENRLSPPQNLTLTRNFECISRNSDYITRIREIIRETQFWEKSQNCEFLSHNCDFINRDSDFISRNSEFISRKN